MNELVFVNEKNEVVTDSLLVAEMFSKRHDNVVADIVKQMEYAGEEYSLLNFQETHYQHPQNKQIYPKYILTQKAFTLVVMSYNTKEAVQTKIKFIDEFERMKEYIQESQKPKTQLELLQMTVNQMLEQEKKINTIEQNLEKLQEDVEKRITLDHSQQQVMRNAVNKRVYYLWNDGKVDKNVFDDTRKIFPLLWKDVKNAYRVNAYANILQRDFEEAMKFIEGWRPLFSSRTA